MVYKICHRRVNHTKTDNLNATSLSTSAKFRAILRVFFRVFFVAADKWLRIPRKRTIISRNRDTHILAVNLTPRDIRELAKVPFAICTKLLAFKNLEKKEVYS